MPLITMTPNPTRAQKLAQWYMRRQSSAMGVTSRSWPTRIGLKNSTVAGTASGKKYPAYVSPSPINSVSVWISM